MKKAAIIPGVLSLLFVFIAWSCHGDPSPDSIKKKAEKARISGDCREAVFLYRQLAEIDPHSRMLADKRIGDCMKKLSYAAARELNKDGKSGLPPTNPSSVRAGAEYRPVMKKCDPTWRKRISEIEDVLKPVEARLNGLSSATSSVEKNYTVKPSPDGRGYDFALPADTSPAEAKAFEENVGREYAKYKSEQNLLGEKASKLRSRIREIESEARTQGVLNECLH